MLPFLLESYDIIYFCKRHVTQDGQIGGETYEMHDFVYCLYFTSKYSCDCKILKCIPLS